MTQPKYQIGQEVWLINENRVVSKTITIVGFREMIFHKLDMSIAKKIQHSYSFDTPNTGEIIFHEECELYPSKESLIESLK